MGKNTLSQDIEIVYVIRVMVDIETQLMIIQLKDRGFRRNRAGLNLQTSISS